jgi:predicted transcriptional regulator
MTAIKLPDDLVEALKDHDVQDIQAIEAFVSRAAWKQLEEEEAKATMLDESEIEETVKMCQEGLAAIEAGNFYTLDEFIAKRTQKRESEKVV